MRRYVQLSGLLYALVALGHLIRVVARWPLLIAGYPLPALVSLLVMLVALGMASWAWMLLTSAEPSVTAGGGKGPPSA